MPQNRHCSMRRRAAPLRCSSVSAPVDVMVPFEVAAVVMTSGDEDASTEDAAGADGEDATAAAVVDKSVAVTVMEVLLARLWWWWLLWWLVLLLVLLLLLLRVERLLARAEMRRLRSSRSKDFSGETCGLGAYIVRRV